MKRCLFACGISLLLAACQTTSSPEEEKAPKKEEKEAVYYIGSVYKIYADSKFALVRVVKQKPAAGTTLISHPIAGPHLRMANLQVSTETIDNNITPLIAADIRSGHLEVGDAVYIYQAIGQPKPAMVAAPPTPTGETPPGQPAATGVVTMPTANPAQQLGTLPASAAGASEAAVSAAEAGVALPSATDGGVPAPLSPSQAISTPASSPAPAPVSTPAPAEQPKPHEVPSRIKNVPRNFSDWENM